MTDDLKHIKLLQYLYAGNAIPVWLLGPGGKLLFTTAPRAGMRSEEELAPLLNYLSRQKSPVPGLHMVGETEMIAFFTYQNGGQSRLLLAGPVFREHPVAAGRAGRLSVDYLYTTENAAVQQFILFTPGMDEAAFCEYACLLYSLYTGLEENAASMVGRADFLPLQSLFDRQLDSQLFDLREEICMPPHSYELEQQLLTCVRNGDTETLAARPPLTLSQAHGPTVKDEYRRRLYDMVALATLVTRAAIEGGLHTETAYTLSDLYIRRLDNTKTVDELLRISRAMLTDFTQKVRTMRGVLLPSCSVPVRRCCEYIRANLHQPLSLEQAAQACFLSPKYLSRLFCSQVGMPFTSFVQQERIAEAKRLLVGSNMPLYDISSTLCFSSQSYFTKIFTQNTGQTPQQYRKTYRAPGV